MKVFQPRALWLSLSGHYFEPVFYGVRFSPEHSGYPFRAVRQAHSAIICFSPEHSGYPFRVISHVK